MAKFELKCVNRDGKKASFIFDSSNSLLTDSDGNPIFPYLDQSRSIYYRPKHISSDTPIRKIPLKNTTFKIQLGQTCNYRCSYCLQSHDKQEGDSYIPIKEFVDLIPPSEVPTRRFEFWGGEPLLYWDILKPLAEAIRAKFPDAPFYMPTNGSLLTYERNEWLKETGFAVSVSHDGSGQWQRGKDPLSDPSQQLIIQHLFNLLNSEGRFSFNPVLTKANQSRREINNWFLKEIGHSSFSIGEGGFITPHSEDVLQNCLLSPQERITYSHRTIQEIRYHSAPNFIFPVQKMDDFYYSLERHRLSKSLPPGCDATREFSLSVDIRGNVLACQNCNVNNSDDKDCIGNIYDLDNVISGVFKGWSYRKECHNCPVIALCHGGAPCVEGQFREAMCRASFGDLIAMFAAVIEYVTGGFLPYYIDGPLTEERKDFFGVVESGDLMSLFDGPIKES